MKTFSFTRLNQLIKIDLFINKKSLLITSSAFIVILALLPFHFSGSIDVYFWILYIGGLMITNQAFNEIHDHRKAFLYLTLPCSNFERFLSKFLITTILYSVGLLLIFYFFSLLSVFTNTIFFHRDITLFDLSSARLWIGIGKYIIFQSIFLLGAAYFQKSSITKTTLVLGCTFIVLSVSLFIFSWMICPSCSQNGLFYLIEKTFHGVYFICWMVVAPICWYITYIRIMESEIK